jgi:uncharacterized protein GlcG (DUF336 family)
MAGQYLMLGGTIMLDLTLADAEKALAAAKAKAMEMGVALSISVVDARGDLSCMVRMDGAPWRTPYISRGKARASACWGLPSVDLTDRSMQPVFRAVMEVERGEFIPGQGALPIMRNGEMIGAIGGSGGTSQEDEDAARAGMDAIT